jgi:hypothetical protein
MKQFATAARRGKAAVNNPADVEFEFETDPGVYVEMTAHAPTTGQLALFFSHQNDIGTGSVRALFQLMKDVLDPEDYTVMEAQLRKGLDVDVIVEMVQYLVSEWSARPTTPLNGSSESPRSTGRPSTVKRRPMASTTSNSR